MLTMWKTLLAALAIVGLIDAAFSSSRHAEGNGSGTAQPSATYLRDLPSSGGQYFRVNELSALAIK
jgi:hypothetical protein